MPISDKSEPKFSVVSVQRNLLFKIWNILTYQGAIRGVLFWSDLIPECSRKRSSSLASNIYIVSIFFLQLSSKHQIPLDILSYFLKSFYVQNEVRSKSMNQDRINNQVNDSSNFLILKLFEFLMLIKPVCVWS